MSCTRRGSSCTPNISWIDGRRKSQFTTSTDDPASPNTAARLALVVVLPSPGDADVTMTTSGSCCSGSKSALGSASAPFPVGGFAGPRSAAAAVCWKSSDVRTARYDSAARESGADTDDEVVLALLGGSELRHFGEYRELERGLRVFAGTEAPIQLVRNEREADTGEESQQPTEDPARHRVVERGSARRRDERVGVAGWPGNGCDRSRPALRSASYSPLPIGTAWAGSSVATAGVGAPAFCFVRYCA